MTDISGAAGHLENRIATAERFNLGVESIGSQDFWSGPTNRARRFIEYPTPTDEQRTLRDTLERDNLILGHRREGEEGDKVIYSIPESARPLAYDSSVTREGSYSYTDEELFYDLGELLGDLSCKYGDRPQMIADSIGHTVALVDFVKPGERQLYFVPGIERALVPQPNTVVPEGLYVAQLGSVFDGRFSETAIYFRMGFAEAVNAQRGQTDVNGG